LGNFLPNHGLVAAGISLAALVGVPATDAFADDTSDQANADGIAAVVEGRAAGGGLHPRP